MIFKLHTKLKLIRKYKLRFSLNKYKFKNIFLNKLSKLISMYYNKKVEFNIVKLRSVVFNTDIFTDILKLKLIKSYKYFFLIMENKS